MIITVGGTKGGGGKTTIATNLTVMRARAKREVLLIDADPQGTSSTFTVLRHSNSPSLPKYTCVRLLGEEIVNAYLSLQNKYEDILIDAGGRETDSHRAALGIADVAIVPFQPSSFDIWELAKASKIVKEMRTVNPKLQAFSLINLADPRGFDNEAAAEYAGEVPGLTFIPQQIVNRKAFKRAGAAGIGVVELKPLDVKAAEEMEAVYEFAFRATQPHELKKVGNQ